MPALAPPRRLTVIGLLIAALSLPAATLAQTASSDPAEFDALAAVTLMNEVPADIRASCVPGDPAAAEGAVASAQCQHGDQLLLYLRFDDVASLETNYDLVVGMSSLTQDSGSSCAEGPFEGEYTTADGATGGRLVCQVGTQASTIAAWSDVERLALGLIEKPGAEDWAGLHAAWQAAQLVDATPAMGAPMSPEASSTPPVGSAPPADAAGTIHQWASDATASSQFGETGWSALRRPVRPTRRSTGTSPRPGRRPARMAGRPGWSWHTTGRRPLRGRRLGDVRQRLRDQRPGLGRRHQAGSHRGKGRTSRRSSSSASAPNSPRSTSPPTASASTSTPTWKAGTRSTPWPWSASCPRRPDAARAWRCVAAA